MRLNRLTRNLFFGLLLGLAASFTGRTALAAPSSPIPHPFEDDLRELCILRPQSSTHSVEERERLKAIVDRLAAGDPREVVAAIVEGLRHKKLNREIPAYRAILPELPSIRQQMLREIRLQSDAAIKAGVIACLARVKGADVLRALIPPLEDKRAAARGGLSEVRVCDRAFNVIYSRVAHIDELGFDHSSAMSDAIAPDVPREWREARIAKMKAALTARFGAELNFPDDL